MAAPHQRRDLGVRVNLVQQRASLRVPKANAPVRSAAARGLALLEGGRGRGGAYKQRGGSRAPRDSLDGRGVMCHRVRGCRLHAVVDVEDVVIAFKS